MMYWGVHRKERQTKPLELNSPGGQLEWSEGTHLGSVWGEGDAGLIWLVHNVQNGTWRLPVATHWRLLACRCPGVGAQVSGELLSQLMKAAFF